MSYAVKEIFHTLQGEGANAGRAAILCRFAGCNLWTGREHDRSGARCRFCDTDFRGTDGENGGTYRNAVELADGIAGIWPSHTGGYRTSPSPLAGESPPRARRGGLGRGDPRAERGSEGKDRGLLRHPHTGKTTAPLVVCTGGEPLLQLDLALIRALHARGFEIAVETNGTLPVPPGLDWICVSPKADEELVVRSGNELKLVYPQPDAPPARFEHLAFDYFFLQPMDGPQLQENTRRAVAFCMDHPRWRLSLQLHKILGIS